MAPMPGVPTYRLVPSLDVFPALAVERDDAAGPFRDHAIALPFGGQLRESLVAHGEVLRAVIERELARQAARQLDGADHLA